MADSMIPGETENPLMLPILLCVEKCFGGAGAAALKVYCRVNRKLSECSKSELVNRPDVVIAKSSSSISTDLMFCFSCIQLAFSLHLRARFSSVIGRRSVGMRVVSGMLRLPVNFTPVKAQYFQEFVR